MIDRLELQNFKRYEQQALLLNKKITILVGPNSSGKSSLLKALLAFKQTLEDQNEHSGFLSRGEYVDVGPYKEYVRDHVVERLVHFRFFVKSTGFVRQPWIKSGDEVVVEYVHEEDPGTGHGRLVSFIVSYDGVINSSADLSQESDSRRFISFTRMNKSEDRYKIFISDRLIEAVTPTVRRLMSVDIEKIKKTLSQGGIQAVRHSRRGMAAESVRGTADIMYFVNMVVYSASNSENYLISELTDKLFALAALRDPPQRSSLRTDEKLKVGARGQNVASVYTNFQRRAVKAGKRQLKVKADFDSLMKWIVDLKLGVGLETRTWSDLVDMRTQTDHVRSSSDSITDIGVGFSQAFPILVQLAVMPEGGRLIVEQPELHLYPWAQSRMGRIFCEEARRGEKSIVIETHSEHLIRGVQAHISAGYKNGPADFLQSSDVIVIYVDHDGTAKELRLAENGMFIDQWPAGFFDQGIRDLDEIIENSRSPYEKH